MHNADYAVARCLSVCLSVRLSVSPSHAVILSTPLNIYSIFFTIRYSHTILVFPYKTLWQYSDGDPLTGRWVQWVYKEIAMFDQYLAISLKRYKIRLYANMKLSVSFRMVSDFKGTPSFDAEYLRNSKKYIVSMEYYWELHTPYSRVSFRMTLSDLEWLRV